MICEFFKTWYPQLAPSMKIFVKFVHKGGRKSNEYHFNDIMARASSDEVGSKILYKDPIKLERDDVEIRNLVPDYYTDTIAYVKLLFLLSDQKF